MDTMKSGVMIDELRALIDAHANRESVTINGLHLASAHEPTAPASAITSPIFVVVAQGAKRIVFDDHVYEYGAGDFLIASMDLPITGQFIEASREKPFLGFGLDLRPEIITSLLMEAGETSGLVAEPASLRESSFAVGPASDDLLDAVLRLLRLLDRPADLPVLVPMIEREIVWRLLNGRQRSVVQQIGLANGSLAYIGRVLRWIRENPAESFRVADLAEQANMSLSTFHRHFRAVATMSPVQFQKKVRLQQARLLLLGEGTDVASVGFAVGYDSPSQFSREYRREYGVPPSQDAVRLRLPEMDLQPSGLP